MKTPSTPLLLSLTLAALLAACQSNPIADPPAPPLSQLSSREHFAAQLARITQDTPASQVLELLGQPDDIKTQHDPGGIDLTDIKEIWSYGTDRHLGFATRATIAINTHNLVQYKSGTTGADELLTHMTEQELSRLLRLIAQVKWNNGDQYQPRNAIAAINALQPLGQKIGVAVLNEYFDVSFAAQWAEDDGTFILMRTLFDVPPAQPQATSQPHDKWPRVVYPGYFRPPALGAPDWQPDDLTKLPRFPVLLIDDVPLIVVDGYALAGMPEHPRDHLQELNKHATWRKAPLQPTDHPLDIPKKIKLLNVLKEPEPLFINAECPDLGTIDLISLQLLRLVDTVYRDNQDENALDVRTKTQRRFAAAVEAIRATGIRWNAAKNCYTRRDGTTLPPNTQKSPTYTP